MPQTINQTDFDAVLKKPSSNKAQAKQFLAKYTTPYINEGIRSYALTSSIKYAA